jgi:hypothetical protein
MVNTRSEIQHHIRRATFWSLISGSALIATVRGAIGWVEHGFHIPNGYRVAPADDGSFILLLFGAFFSVYAAVTASMAIIAARDAAKRDDRTRTI